MDQMADSPGGKGKGRRGGKAAASKSVTPFEIPGNSSENKSRGNLRKDPSQSTTGRSSVLHLQTTEGNEGGSDEDF